MRFNARAPTDRASTPAPALLTPPKDLPPTHPGKATKPKLPPRPLSKVFSSAEHGADLLQVPLINTVRFKACCYGYSLLLLLQGFERFRMDETLCDVVLVPGDSDQAFRVHRVIMALSSDYFKAMFTGESGWPTAQRPWRGV